MQPPQLAIGPFSFDPASLTLWRDGVRIALGNRAAEVLGALVAADGAVVTREALIEAAWKGAIVEENNLAVQVVALRRALGLRADGTDWIETVPRVGYRLLRDLPASDKRPALVVLPFLNLSGEPDQDHIADGMVEDLTTAFSRFRSIGVVARVSAFAYKDRKYDARDAARDLNVRYLLEGSIRCFSGRARVTAQLIDGATGEHIWAENFHGSLGDIFAFQDRITSAVVGLLEPTIRRAEIQRALRKHPDNLDANDLYWRGLALLQTADRRSYDDAVEMLDRATRLAPDYAPILAMAAYAHLKQGGGDGALGIAQRLCEQALAADANDPFVLLVAGMLELNLGRSDKGLVLAERAYELNPNSMLICNVTGYLHLTQGHYEQTIACSMRALQLSPGAPERFWAMIGIARAHLAAGRFDEAVLWSLRSLDVEAEQEEVRPILVAAYALLGQIDEAELAHRELLAINPRATIPQLLATLAAPEQAPIREGLRQFAAATARHAGTAAAPLASPPG